MCRIFLCLIAALGIGPAALARGGGGCVAADTLIATPGGPVPIQRIRVGDSILSLRGSTTIVARVDACIVVQPEVFIQFSGKGFSVRVTPEHPVATAPGVFKSAATLREGDQVLVASTPQPAWESITSIARCAATTPACNLLVSEAGTYLAGSVLVHNKGCFLPETPILTDKGEQWISRIQPGDVVLAFEGDGRLVQTTVRSVIRKVAKEFASVETPGHQVSVTLDHPFFTGPGTFKTLESLRVGDNVLAENAGRLTAQPILRITRIARTVTVYNLQTDQPHTFFAAGLAVHNKGGGGFGGGGSGRGGGYSHSGHSSWTAPKNLNRILLLSASFGAFLGGLFSVFRYRYHSILTRFLFGALAGGISIPLLIVVFFIGPPFAVFLGVLLWNFFNRNKSEENLDFVYSQKAVSLKSGKTLNLLKFIARVDPGWVPEKLTAVAQNCFQELQRCWQARDYGPMQPFLMPDLYRLHCQQLRGLLRNHEINMVAPVTVDRIDLVNVRYPNNPAAREFTALITATAKDYYLDDRTNQFLRGDTSPSSFQEFWTFQWSDAGWKLREIEQSRESEALKHENFFEQFTDFGVRQIYKEHANEEGPAGPWVEPDVGTKETRVDRLLNFLVRTDKMWERGAMLERARQTFLQVMLAWESGDPEQVPSHLLFPDLNATIRSGIAEMKRDGRSVEYRNLCVRKAELVLVRNYTDNNKDEFTVRIGAHAQYAARQGSTVLQQQDDVTPFEEFWTFGRLDQEWKLKEILQTAQGLQQVGEENIDEESSPQQLQWYYQQTRSV